MLVRSLCRRDAQLKRSRQTAEPPTIPDVYEDPGVLAANPYFANFKRAYLQGVVLRPSTVTGKKYPEVSRAYFEAVYAVLTRKKTAAKAAADLQDQLVQMTGLKARAAGTNSPSVGAAAAIQ